MNENSEEDFDDDDKIEDLLKLSESLFAEDWDSDEDKIWDDK
jgi:hypothetical protein